MGARLLGSVFVVALGAAGGTSEGALLAGTEIVAAPTSVLRNGTYNSLPQAFNEKQNVVLSEDLHVDDGVIPAGTLVDSHMVFLNPAPGKSVDFNDAKFQFDGPVLGVMSDTDGALEVASTQQLGLTAVTYPTAPEAGRGLDTAGALFPFGRENVSYRGANLSLDMAGSGFVRVVTASRAGGNRAPTLSPFAAVEPAAGRLGARFAARAADPDGDPLNYMWQFGDGSTSVEANPLHVYPNPGTYAVTAAVSDGQRTVSANFIVAAGETFGFKIGSAQAFVAPEQKTAVFRAQGKLDNRGELAAAVPLVIALNGVVLVDTTIDLAQLGEGRYSSADELVRLRMNPENHDWALEIASLDATMLTRVSQVELVIGLGDASGAETFQWTDADVSMTHFEYRP